MPISSDPEQRAKQIEALKKNRNPYSKTTHGVMPFFRSGVHPCDRCVKRSKCDRFKNGADCSYLEEFQNNIESMVMDLDYVDEQDRPLAQLLAKEMAAVALCEMYFSEEGMIIHDKRKRILTSQPLVTTYNTFKNSARQTMQALGLGPTARTKLDMDKLKVVKQMEEMGLEGEDDVEGTDFLND